MRNVLLWFGFVAFFSTVSAKSDYFSDVSEEDYKKLQEIVRYLRKRVEEAPAAEEVSEKDSDAESSKDDTNPPFVYTLPKLKPKSDEFLPFAVGPSDPRFYRDFGGPADPTVVDSDEQELEKRPRTEETGRFDDEVPPGSLDQDQSHSPVRHVSVTSVYDQEGRADVYFTAIVAGCSAAAVVAVIAIGIGCYRLQKNAKAAADVDYPAYGVTGPNKDVSPTSGDRRLAQSAQMYHYQHQKQQIIAMESLGSKGRRGSISDAESEDENEEGDYTVYECPGLAPTGEMEVKNPLFQDDQTPAAVAKPANESSEECRELPNLISFE